MIELTQEQRQKLTEPEPVVIDPETKEGIPSRGNERLSSTRKVYGKGVPEERARSVTVW